MPKRTLATILLIFLSSVTLAQNAALPVPTDLKAVLVPTFAPPSAIGLRWSAPDGPWGYRVYRSEGDSLHFHFLGRTASRSYFDQITTGPNTYFYQVRTFAGVVDSQIVESAPSNTAWVTLGPPPSRVRGMIAGIVKDDTTGNPIRGVLMQFYRMSPSTNVISPLSFAITDSLGRYSTEVDTGTYTIHAEPPPSVPPAPPPYAPEWFDNVREQSRATKVAVEEGKTSEADFGLSRLQFPIRPKGVIAGTVTDDSTHMPIPFAVVRFFPQGVHILIYPPPSVLTDSLGQYRAVLDTGVYLVRADGIGIPTFVAVPYQPEWFDNVTAVGQATPVPVTPGSIFAADFALGLIVPPKLATIEGTVTNDVGNTDQPTVPLAGATVAILRPIQAMNSPYVLSTPPTVAWSDGAEVDGLGYCGGIVWRGRTDSAGHYRASVVSGNTYIAVAAKRGYLPEYYREKANPLQSDLIKADGDLTNIDFTLAPNPALQNSISGNVRDSLGTGVPSRIVLFPCASYPMMRALMFGHTDSTGAYVLREVRAGKYLVLAVPFRGYAPAFYSEGEYGVRSWQDADTVAVSGDVTGIDIGVRPVVPRGAVVLAGQVVDGAGLPLGGVRVFVLSSADGGILGFSVTDNSGSFTVEGLASIPVMVAFDREGYDPGLKQITPAQGEFAANIGTVSMSAAATGTPGVVSRAPAAYAMYPNYPNPFNPSTTIRFDLPVAAVARIVVYNILGQEIATLRDGLASAGAHSVTWDGKDGRGKTVAGGLYLVRFTAFNAAGAQQYSQMRKMVLVK